MREKVIESYLRDQVKILGGKAYKFASPGNKGVPDRIVVLPGGRIFFAELKAPKGKLTEKQLHVHDQLRTLGCIVYGRIDSKEAVDTLLRYETR